MSAPRSVAVVGGGVVGLCTAYYLRKGGAEVTVVEANTTGSGASHGNAGWITPSLAAPLPAPGLARTALRSIRDPESALYVPARNAIQLAPWLYRFWRRCAAPHHSAGMRATSRLAEGTMELFDGLRDDGVEFDMAADGILFACLEESNATSLLDGLRPLEEFGYSLPPSVLSGAEVIADEPALGARVAAGFAVEGERAVVPHTLMQGMTRRVREMGVEVLEDAEVTGFRARQDRAPTLLIGERAINADAVVLAAGAWTTRLAADLGVRIPMQAGKGYSASVLPDVMPKRMLYLAEAHVGATRMGSRLRIAGTMELSGVNDYLDARRLNAVLSTSSKYLRPWAKGSEAERWCGMRPVTSDGLPVLGAAPGLPDVYLATGHSMLGITLGPATGTRMADLILGKAGSDVLAPFSADRFAGWRAWR